MKYCSYLLINAADVLDTDGAFNIPQSSGRYTRR